MEGVGPAATAAALVAELRARVLGTEEGPAQAAAGIVGDATRRHPEDASAMLGMVGGWELYW